MDDITRWIAYKYVRVDLLSFRAHTYITIAPSKSWQNREEHRKSRSSDTFAFL
jgi:hypothetical protein